MREQLSSLCRVLIDRFELDIEVFTVKWFMSMWCVDLPFEYAITVLELYLLDG